MPNWNITDLCGAAFHAWLQHKNTLFFPALGEFSTGCFELDHHTYSLMEGHVNQTAGSVLVYWASVWAKLKKQAKNANHWRRENVSYFQRWVQLSYVKTSLNTDCSSQHPQQHCKYTLKRAKCDFVHLGPILCPKNICTYFIQTKHLIKADFTDPIQDINV